MKDSQKLYPSVIICPDGGKEWYLNGKRHREDGPAIEYADGTKEWYLNDSPPSEVHQRIGGLLACLLVDPRGHALMAYQGRYYAGCRAFTYEEATAHWGSRFYRDGSRGMQYVAAILTYEKSEGRAGTT